MASRFALTITLLIFAPSCAVKSPVRYAGDTAYKNVPLEATRWDPEEASYQQPPLPAPRVRMQRQSAPEPPSLFPDEEGALYDYFYLYTPERVFIKRRKVKERI